jgi:hypothetical protein
MRSDNVRLAAMRGARLTTILVVSAILATIAVTALESAGLQVLARAW